MEKSHFFLLLTNWKSNPLIHYSSFIILLVLCAASCEKKELHIPVSTADSNYTIQIKNLYRQGSRYKNSGNDTLNRIAGELIRIGEIKKDTTVVINGKLLQANYEWMLSNYPKAMKLSIEALTYAEKINLEKILPEIYGTIGNIYKENDDYPSALEAAEKGLAVAQSIKDTAQIIFLMRLRAMFTHSYGTDTDNKNLQLKSLQLHLEGLRIAQSSPKFERSRIGYYDNISQYYKNTEDYDKGIFYARKGVELAQKYDQRRSLTYSYNWLGEIFFYQGQHEKGISYLEEALQIAVSIKSAFREMEINNTLYECYHSIGNDKKALVYYKRRTKISDSLQVHKNLTQIEQLQVQYQTEKKDQQISLLAAVNRGKTKETIFVLAGLVILFVLFVFLFILYRSIRHRNILLTANNQTINEQSQKLQLLMKELHHRVKNNLQIVSSLLSLQSNYLSDKDAQRAVKMGQQRIEAMSLIHRSLYMQENPNIVNMQEYITDLLESIMQSFGIDKADFDLILNIEITEMDVDIALPLGLIINEWVTNALKYAYKDGGRPLLLLSLKPNQGILLEIKDNGPGMSYETWEKPSNSFGIKLVKVLSRQLRGECRIEQDDGTRFNLQIPLREIKKAG